MDARTHMHTSVHTHTQIYHQATFFPAVQSTSAHYFGSQDLVTVFFTKVMEVALLCELKAKQKQIGHFTVLKLN